MSNKRLLRLAEVRNNVGLSRSEIYRRMALGKFPKSVPLGTRVRAWAGDEIDSWIAERIAAREERQAA
jgi:prophage regulatory protein